MNFRLFRTLFMDIFAVFLHILDSESKYGVKPKSIIRIHVGALFVFRYL